MPRKPLPDRASPRDAAQLFTRILYFLKPRPRSLQEIKTRLASLGATLEQQTAIIAKLESLHYLDDSSFATYLVSSRRLQGRSKHHIQSELTHFGIAKEQSEAALQASPNDQIVIQSLIKQKSRLTRPQLIRYLGRRGFSWSDIKSALESSHRLILRRNPTV